MANILIIEDEVALRAVLTAALQLRGHKVLQAADGRRGLAVLESHPVDLVVTDVMMPDHDGLEVLMTLRKAVSTVKVIAMTGHPVSSELFLRFAKALGAHRVLEKPFKIEDLFQAVADTLDGA